MFRRWKEESAGVLTLSEGGGDCPAAKRQRCGEAYPLSPTGGIHAFFFTVAYGTSGEFCLVALKGTATARREAAEVRRKKERFPPLAARGGNIFPLWNPLSLTEVWIAGDMVKIG